MKKGMTELQIANEIKNFFNENGSNGLSFEPIVASGPNSSKPHAQPTDRIIESGDIILIDMGCKVNGYCSDMTRTVFVDEITEEMKKQYAFVSDLQNQLINLVRDGRAIKDIVLLSENNYSMTRNMMMHSMGHGIGLECHELPFLTKHNMANLKENMTIAIEPGIYIEGKWGIRIEDTILVQKTGCNILTKSNKEIIII